MARMSKDERSAKIMKAAMELAEKHGYHAISMRQVADRAKCSRSLVDYHFGSSKAMIDAIVDHAATWHNLPVLAQALIARHPIALKAPEALRKAALKHAMGA